MEASGSALESRDDCAFNALGLVQKLALSVKCETNAQPQAKKSNAYFDFRKFIKRHISNRICIGFPIGSTAILDDLMKNRVKQNLNNK